MSVSETVLEDEKKKMSQPKKENIRFRGKDVKTAKLRKKLRHKPKLIVPILINLSIVLVIIGIILIMFYL